MLIISDEKTKTNISKKALAQILSQLFLWRYTWLYNDTNGYLSFYSSDFIRDDGMKYDAFVTYKKRVFSKAEKKTILFSDINVVPYPNTPDVYQITFKELYSSATYQFNGEKILMARLTKDNKMKIFTEK